MTEKPNFFKLGVFTLIAVVLMVGGILLFGSGKLGEEEVYYETYFANSVVGLTKSSPVYLNGVKIGEVQEVNFVRRRYKVPETDDGTSEYGSYVRVVIAADEDELPRHEIQGDQSRIKRSIEKGLRLQLASNLITGQAYLESVYLDPQRFPSMEVPWQPEYYYVPSAPSVITTMKDSLDAILSKLSEIQFDKVADNLNGLLVSLNETVQEAELGALSQKMQKMVDNADQAILDSDIKEIRVKTIALVDELRQSNAALKELLAKPDSVEKLDNLPVMIDEFSKTLQKLGWILNTETPEVKRIMDNIRQLTENLNYLSEQLKDNPSQLLLSTPPSKQEN